MAQGTGRDGEQVAVSGWAIDGAMLGLKMRRHRGANGERNQISSPTKGATTVARAEGRGGDGGGGRRRRRR
ncbi:hypothetical protein U1Q18_010413 [Sarracenia purpurea var. burkii]